MSEVHYFQSLTKTLSPSSSNESDATSTNSNAFDGSPGKTRSQTLYKTELCRSFGETGFCRYGSKCQFAHGEAELRPVSRHKKYKTEKCKNFEKDGHCPYGPRCRFLHSEEKSSKTRSPSSINSNSLSPVGITPLPSPVLGSNHVSNSPSYVNMPSSAITVENLSLHDFSSYNNGYTNENGHFSQTYPFLYNNDSNEYSPMNNNNNNMFFYSPADYSFQNMNSNSNAEVNIAQSQISEPLDSSKSREHHDEVPSLVNKRLPVFQQFRNMASVEVSSYPQ